MKFLRVYLSPSDAAEFSVIIPESDFGDGETKSRLPFDGREDRRITLLKMLESIRFRPENFTQAEEQEWMVKQGFLTIDRQAFAPDAHAKTGQVLFESLFPPESLVRTVLSKAVGGAESDRTHLHIQLQIPANTVQRAPISEYPWELVHDGMGFLAHRQITFSRYIAHEAAPPALPLVDHINVLLVSSGASDPQNGLYPLPAYERLAVRNGLRRAQEAGRIRLVELESATFSHLQTYLTERRGKDAPQVVHFDGHGNYGRRCEARQANGAFCHTFHSRVAVTHCTQCGAPLPDERQGYLLFEGKDRGPDYVSAQILGSELQKAGLQGVHEASTGIALAVLSACQSGLALGGRTIFTGVAQSLIRYQVSAVVGMQYVVAVPEAAAFAERFYQSLGQRDPLAFAVSRGRGAMGLEGDQWYRPILYLRWKDNAGGQLFVTQEGDFPDAAWLEEHAQIAQENFVEHMRNEDDMDTDHAVGRYLDTLVRERLSPMGKEGSVPFPISMVCDHPGARWLVFGDAGSGKTAALLKLAAETAVRADLNATQPIPVYIKLNRFRTKGSLDDLLELCARSLRTDLATMKALWRDGRRRILFLLDGYNEVGADYREDCSLAIEDLMEGRRHHYVITSRPGGEAEGLPKNIKGMKILEITPLSGDQIRTFAQEHAPGLFDRMGSRLKELATNPSVLQLLVRACAEQAEGELPNNLGHLYQIFIDDHIFNKREPSKKPAPTVFSYNLAKRPVLGKLADRMTADSETRTMRNDELEKELVSWLKEAVDKNPHQEVVRVEKWRVEGFLSETIQNGILREVDGSLEFMHQSVQDYFTATALADASIEEVLELVPPAEWDPEHPRENLRRTPYFDAIGMLSGIQTDSSDLVRALLDRDPVLASSCFRGRQRVSLEVEQLLVQKVLQGLEAQEEEEQLRAMECVNSGHLDHQEIVDRLTTILEADGGEIIRPNAALSLKAVLGRKALLLLFRTALDHSDAITRCVAADSLVSVMGVEDDVILRYVILRISLRISLGRRAELSVAGLKPEGPTASEVARQALTLLAEERSVADLAKAALKGPPTSHPAFMALRLCHRHDGIEELMSIARDRSQERQTRNGGLYTTTYLGYSDAVSAPLLTILNDSTEDAAIRSSAARAIGVVLYQQEFARLIVEGPIDVSRDLRTALLRIAGDPEQPSAIRAQATLSTVASGVEADLDDALGLIQDAANDPLLRGLVAAQLPRFLLNPLPAWMTESSFELQVKDILLAQGYGDDETVRKWAKVQDSLLRVALAEDSDDLRSVIATGLAQLAGSEDRLLQVILDEAQPAGVQQAAIVTLFHMKTEQAVSCLIGAVIDSKSDQVRRYAIAALEPVSPERTAASLEAILKDAKMPLERREHAAMGMLFMSSKETKLRVLEIAQTEEDRLTRGTATFAGLQWNATIGDDARDLTPAERLTMRAMAYYGAQCSDDQVIGMFDEAIELNPEDPDLYYGRSYIFLTKKEFARALQDVRQGVKMAPDRADLQENLGYVHWQMGQLEEALKAYQCATALDPGEMRLVFAIGRICFLLRRFGEALQAYRRAVELDPGNIAIRSALVGAFIKMGQYEEAERELPAVMEGIDQEAALTQAQLEGIRGNVDTALSFLEEAFEKGECTLHDLQLDPSFDAIRDNTRFKALLDQRALL